MKTKILTALALSALIFSSCDKNNEGSDIKDDSRVAVQFSSGIEVNKKMSRAYDGSWETNDKIGIFMFKTGTSLSSENISEEADNKAYQVLASGNGVQNFGPVSDYIYFPVDGSKVDFLAYYPYKSSGTGEDQINNYTYPVNVSNQNPQQAIDLLHSAKVSDKHKGDRQVDLVFAHKLTKLEFQITNGTGISEADLTNLTVTLQGFPTKSSLNLNSGVLGISSAVSPIEAVTTDNGKSSEAIIIPTSSAVTNGKFEFKLNGTNEVFTYNLPATDLFPAAKKVQYQVTISRNGVTVTGQITDWVTEDRGPIIAD